MWILIPEYAIENTHFGEALLSCRYLEKSTEESQ